MSLVAKRRDPAAAPAAAPEAEGGGGSADGGGPGGSGSGGDDAGGGGGPRRPAGARGGLNETAYDRRKVGWLGGRRLQWGGWAARRLGGRA